MRTRGKNFPRNKFMKSYIRIYHITNENKDSNKYIKIINLFIIFILLSILYVFWDNVNDISYIPKTNTDTFSITNYDYIYTEKTNKKPYMDSYIMVHRVYDKNETLSDIGLLRTYFISAYKKYEGNYNGCAVSDTQFKKIMAYTKVYCLIIPGGISINIRGSNYPESLIEGAKVYHPDIWLWINKYSNNLVIFTRLENMGIKDYKALESVDQFISNQSN